MVTSENNNVFGKCIGFGKFPALLVIDVTRAFTEPPRPLATESGFLIREANRLLDAAHGHDIPVFFTRVVYDSPDFSDAGLWGRKIGGQKDLLHDSDGIEFDPRLHHQETAGVLAKKYASSFFGTDLASRLTAMGVDTLIIAGLSTSGCVRASTVDAIQLGFRPIVVREAVGDRWPEAHDQALADIQAKYGDVLAIDEVLAYFDGLGAARSA